MAFPFACCLSGSSSRKDSKKIKVFRQKAIKIGDAEAVKACNEGISALKDLSELMKTAYATRVAADYHPEILIKNKAGDRFTLNAVGITEAHGWPDKSRLWGSVIERAWRMADA